MLTNFLDQNKKTLFTEIFPFTVGLVLGFYFLIFQYTQFDLSQIPGDLGDGRFNNYILEHVHNFFCGNEDFWNSGFMYPEPNIITYSDNLSGTAPIYSAFRLTGFDRETSYQLWFLVLMALNYICSYTFLRSIFKNPYSAAIGAFIFAFSMALNSQMTHAQTFPRFPIPLAFLMCYKFYQDLDPKYLFWTITLVVFQFYCGIYLGFFLVLPIAIFIIGTFIQQKTVLFSKLRSIKWSLSVLGSVLFNLSILLILMLPYAEHSSPLAANPYENIIGSLPTIKSYLASYKGSLLWSSMQEIGIEYAAFWDHRIFSGLLTSLTSLFTLGLTLLIILKSKFVENLKIDKKHSLMLITGFIISIIYIRYENLSFYWFIYHIPGFESMRSLARVINMQLIFFAFSAAWLFSFVNKRSQKLQLSVFVLIMTLLTIDNYTEPDRMNTYTKLEAQNRIIPLIDQMQKLPKNAIISYEPTEENLSTAFVQIDGMMASQLLGLKCINGYTATSPSGFDYFWRKYNKEGRRIWLEKMNISDQKIHIIK